jgi:hypothetical protein
MDRHKIWRNVGANYETMSQAAPEGYAPVVEVFLMDRPEPVRLSQVETHRDPEYPWALLLPEMKGERVEYRAEHPLSTRPCAICKRPMTRPANVVVCGDECRRERKARQRRRELGVVQRSRVNR